METPIEIDFKLAKELKDAGFRNTEILERKVVDLDGEAFFVPTLSELVEACGKVKLEPDRDSYVATGARDWSLDTVVLDTFGAGKTPEIAVSKLFIALNKKQP